MAIDYWHGMSILFGSVEAAGHGKNVMCETTVAPLDTTALDTTGWTTLIGGLKTGTVNLDFMSDLAEGSLDDKFWSYLGVAGVPHSVGVAAADGSLAYTFAGIPLSFKPIEGAPGDLAMGNISGQASGSPVVRGLFLHPGATARIASGTGVERELGVVSSTKRLYAGLHVLAASGTTPSLTVKVQSDATGFATPTDQITFAAAVDLTNPQFLSAAGPITDDFFRVSWTVSGTTPSFRFVVACGIA